MTPKAQKEPSWTGGRGTKGNWDQWVHKFEAHSSFKRTQIVVKLAPRFHGLDSWCKVALSWWAQVWEDESSYDQMARNEITNPTSPYSIYIWTGLSLFPLASGRRAAYMEPPLCTYIKVGSNKLIIPLSPMLSSFSLPFCLVLRQMKWI